MTYSKVLQVSPVSSTTSLCSLTPKISTGCCRNSMQQRTNINASSGNGKVKIDNAKVSAVLDMQRPGDITDLRRFFWSTRRPSLFQIWLPKQLRSLLSCDKVKHMLCLSSVLTFYDATPQQQFVCRQLIVWSRRSDLTISRWKLATSRVCFALHFGCRTTLCSNGEGRASFRVDRYEVPGLCHRH